MPAIVISHDKIAYHCLVLTDAQTLRDEELVLTE